MEEGDVELGPLGIDDTHQRPGSIFMVPSVYRDLSRQSYTPRVVSIGPLHHQDEHLKGFELQKATYMHNLLHNILSDLDSTPEEIYEECLMWVRGSIDRIKACYFGMRAYPDLELAEMMVKDACFILAFLYDYDISDDSLGPIELLLPHILLDMVLIENQIPFFVLQDIFESTFLKRRSTRSLADLIIPLQKFVNIFEGDLVTGKSRNSSTHDHILGFIHKSYQNPDLDSPTDLEYPKFHSVIELDRSGVRFSNKLDAKWPMAMELKLSRFLCFPSSWSKPTLKMPILKLDDYKELIIRNLIVYEYSSKVQTCVTSYMQALDMLIDSPEDVAKLVKSKVIVNCLGSDEEAANLMNNVLKEVPCRDFYYQDEWKNMDEYYNAYWPKLMAELRRKYFSNPWSVIALIAGIILFVLTVVQTVYSVKGGVKDSKAA